MNLNSVPDEGESRMPSASVGLPWPVPWHKSLPRRVLGALQIPDIKRLDSSPQNC